MKTMRMVWLMCFLMAAAVAQDKPADKETKDKAAAEERAAAPGAGYKVEYTLVSLSGKQRTAERKYSVTLVNEQSSGSLRVGSRAPISTGTSVQYVDIGINIDSRIFSRGGQMWVDSRVEFSSLPDGPERGSQANPVIRQVRLQGMSPLALGKNLVIGTLDDPTTSGQMLIEMTVTLVRP